MARQVIWLPTAIADLDAIACYIAADSTAYAASVVDEMLSTAARLADFPELGRRVPEWNDDRIRERVVYSYRLIYRLTAEAVQILAVIHGARILPDQPRHPE